MTEERFAPREKPGIITCQGVDYAVTLREQTIAQSNAFEDGLTAADLAGIVALEKSLNQEDPFHAAEQKGLLARDQAQGEAIFPCLIKGTGVPLTLNDIKALEPSVKASLIATQRELNRRSDYVGEFQALIERVTEAYQRNATAETSSQTTSLGQEANASTGVSGSSDSATA